MNTWWVEGEGGTNWEIRINIHTLMSFPGGASDKEPACQNRRHERRGFKP